MVRAWCGLKVPFDAGNSYRQALLAFAKERNLFPLISYLGREVRLADYNRNSTDAALVAADLSVPADTDLGFWVVNDWEPELVLKDPSKTALMECMQGWGEEWREAPKATL